MKILDRYILKKFLTTFFFVVGLLVLIIVVIDFTDKNEKFIKNDIPAKEILSYYLAFIPWIASLITPITVFITTVLVTTNLASKTEIVAILSGGISFRRMMVPYFVGALIITGLSFYLNGWLIPNSNKYRIGFEIEYLKKPFHFNEKDIHYKVGDDTYLYIQRYNNNAEVGFRVTLEKIEGTRLVEKLSAKKMTWDTATNKWKLQSWNLRKIGEFSETYEEGMMMDTTINIAPTDFDVKYNLNETLTIDELNDYIERQQSRGADDVKIYQIEKYIRYMLPFTTLILTFMGISVSAEKSTRGGAGFKVALGFLIAFVFIIFFILAKAIAESGSLNPIFAIWLPNIVGTIVAFIMYQFVPR
jgi:lipopolysaccharide export system permease protein